MYNYRTLLLKNLELVVFLWFWKSHEGCIYLIYNIVKFWNSQILLQIQNKGFNIFKMYFVLVMANAPGYVCNHGSQRERDAVLNAMGNAISDIQLWIICVISQNWWQDVRCGWRHDQEA